MTNYLGLHINEGLVWKCILMKGDLGMYINEGIFGIAY
jgi:hypothetical protein